MYAHALSGRRFSLPNSFTHRQLTTSSTSPPPIMTDSIDQLLAEMDDLCAAEPFPVSSSYLSPFRQHNINAACFRRNASNAEGNDTPGPGSGPDSFSRYTHSPPDRPPQSSPPQQSANASRSRRAWEQSPVSGTSSRFWSPQNIDASPVRGQVLGDGPPGSSSGRRSPCDVGTVAANGDSDSGGRSQTLEQNAAPAGDPPHTRAIQIQAVKYRPW